MSVAAYTLPSISSSGDPGAISPPSVSMRRLTFSHLIALLVNHTHTSELIHTHAYTHQHALKYVELSHIRMGSMWQWASLRWLRHLVIFMHFACYTQYVRSVNKSKYEQFHSLTNCSYNVYWVMLILQKCVLCPKESSSCSHTVRLMSFWVHALNSGMERTFSHSQIQTGAIKDSCYHMLHVMEPDQPNLSVLIHF